MELQSRVNNKRKLGETADAVLSQKSSGHSESATIDSRSFLVVLQYLRERVILPSYLKDRKFITQRGDLCLYYAFINALTPDERRAVCKGSDDVHAGAQDFLQFAEKYNSHSHTTVKESGITYQCLVNYLNNLKKRSFLKKFDWKVMKTLTIGRLGIDVCKEQHRGRRFIVCGSALARPIREKYYKNWMERIAVANKPDRVDRAVYEDCSKLASTLPKSLTSRHGITLEFTGSCAYIHDPAYKQPRAFTFGTLLDSVVLVDSIIEFRLEL
jgi:hypothetical protein